jgi:integrase
MHRKLTDRTVAQLPSPATGRIDVWDQTLPAFGVRISASGSRTWIAAIRRAGTSSRITLGKHPAMQLAEARAKARAMMTGEAAAPAPRGATFADFAERFLAHGRDRRGRPLRPATTRAYKFVLEKAAAQLHTKRITQVRRADIAEVLHEVAQERGDATAALTRSALGRFFGWLVETGVLETSPATRTPIYAATPGTRVLEDGEIRAIWSAGGQLGSILRLLLLTGARRSEVGGMRWSELEGDIWTLPAARAKNHLELKLPLPPTALVEIAHQPRILGQDTIFGRGSPVGFSDWGHTKERLDRRLGLRPWKIHDLRRTTRSRLHQLGVAHEVVVRILNHDVSEVTRIYNKYDYLPEMRAALTRWADELMQIAAGPEPEVAMIGAG